jgi:deoxyribonuclease V
MTWPSTAAELESLQRSLAAERPPLWSIPHAPIAIAGCFVCFERGESPRAGLAGERVWAAAAVVREGTLVGTSTLTTEVSAPYVSGCLALREGALLDALVRALPVRPDVVLVDATGRDHPRRAGLALHLGAVIDLPTVGVTHRTLLAEGEPPGEQKGSESPLYLDFDVVGCWLRTKTASRPLAIHPGWRTDLGTAVAVVQIALGRARTPEPLRKARQVARTARSLAQAVSAASQPG